MRESIVAFIHTSAGAALIAALCAVLTGLAVSELITALKLRVWGWVPSVIVFFVFGYLLLTLPYTNLNWWGL